MRGALAGLALTALVAVGCAAGGSEAGPSTTTVAAAGTEGMHDELTPVVQSVPSTPRWYPGADGRTHLQYELMLTNTVPLAVDVTAVVVHGDGEVVATLEGDALGAALAPLGSEMGSGTELPASTVARSCR